jgi:hypothetical protein
VDIFETHALIGVVRDLFVPSQFLLDTFFPTITTSDTEFVDIDVEIGRRRMAPFCSPAVQGRIVEGRSIQTNSFRPAYIKDKRAPDLKRPIRRAIGERIGGGDMSPAQRREANVAYEMLDQIRMIDRRLEWMAASAIQFGSVTVAGDGYPTTVVNFGRDPRLTVALTGGTAWGQTGAPLPSAYIDTWANTVLQLSGAAPDTIMFDTSAYQAFISDHHVIRDLVIPNALDASRMRLAGDRVMTGAIFKGTWGAYALYVYNEFFIDPATDLEQRMLPVGSVFLASSEIAGTRSFSTIMDEDFDYVALPYAPKSWVIKDPSQRLLMMQSSPMVIPFRPNAGLFANVGTAGGATTIIGNEGNYS